MKPRKKMNIDEDIRAMWEEANIPEDKETISRQPTHSEAILKRTACGRQFDFVRAYTDYADVYEVSREVHEAVALSMLAGVANRNVWIEWGTIVPLDTWFLLTTGSGGGRNTAIRKCRRILELAELDHLVRDIAWGSEPIVKQHFAENPSGMFIWPEVSEQLLDLSKPAFVGVKQWLTNLYDETAPPANKIYRNTGKKKNTPPIEFKEAPRTNFIASSSSDWLMANLTTVDSTGGFLARWIHVHAQGKRKLIPKPRPSNKRVEAPLASRLRQVSQLKGEADLSDVEGLYETWYMETAKRFDAQPNQDVAQAYFNRHRNHVLKLAVLFEMSCTGTLKVTLTSMKRALDFARRVENHIFRLLPTGFEKVGHELGKMLELVGQAKTAGLLLSDFTQAFKNLPAYQRNDRLRTLLDARDIYCFRRPTAGRAASVLVHKDSLQGYKAGHADEGEQ